MHSVPSPYTFGWNTSDVKRTRGGFSGYCSPKVMRREKTPPERGGRGKKTGKRSRGSGGEGGDERSRKGQTTQLCFSRLDGCSVTTRRLMASSTRRLETGRGGGGLAMVALTRRARTREAGAGSARGGRRVFHRAWGAIATTARVTRGTDGGAGRATVGRWGGGFGKGGRRGALTFPRGFVRTEDGGAPHEKVLVAVRTGAAPVGRLRLDRLEIGLKSQHRRRLLVRRPRHGARSKGAPGSPLESRDV